MALSRRDRALWLLGLTAAGLAARLFFAFHWYGSGDVLTFDLVGARAQEDLLHLYSTNIDYVYWPYGPGYLGWLVGAHEIADAAGLAFHKTVQLLPIAADLGVAALVYHYLGLRGARDSVRIGAFAVVMLGPAFVAISGYHGQFDAVAILPGVAALVVWERRPEGQRAIEAGLLLGLGGALKTVPLLLVLPLLFTTRSWRESAQLVAATATVALLICLPFYLAEPAGFRGGPIEYSGAPGRGGLSLLLDPGFAADRRFPTGPLDARPDGLADWISSAGGPITALALAGLALFLWRYRPEPAVGAVLLWLTVFVFSPNFLLQYLVWALPFFLMAGYVWQTAALQVALVPALLLTYLSPGWYGRTGADAYVAMMAALWVLWVLALVWVARRVVASGGGEATLLPQRRSTSGASI
jgi:hypothetical protein